MAIRIEDEYAESVAADASYPEGSFKNVSSPGGTDGTPFEKLWPNDIQGLLQKILKDANINANGAPDTAVLSQYLNGIKYIAGRNSYQNDIDYDIDSLCQGSDGIWYTCLIANGPASSVVDPVGNPLTWEAFLTPDQLLTTAGYKVFPKDQNGDQLVLQWNQVNLISTPLSFTLPITITTPIIGWMSDYGNAQDVGMAVNALSSTQITLVYTPAAPGQVSYFALGIL